MQEFNAAIQSSGLSSLTNPLYNLPEKQEQEYIYFQP